jgi:hypothetical protein
MNENKKDALNDNIVWSSDEDHDESSIQDDDSEEDEDDSQDDLSLKKGKS